MRFMSFRGADGSPQWGVAQGDGVVESARLGADVPPSLQQQPSV
jgi:hypothetical protein